MLSLIVRFIGNLLMPVSNAKIVKISVLPSNAHISAFTKYVSEVFWVPEELIEVVPEDMETLNYGVGTFGSRSATVVATAITELTEKAASRLSSMDLSLINTTGT